MLINTNTYVKLDKFVVKSTKFISPRECVHKIIRFSFFAISAHNFVPGKY